MVLVDESCSLDLPMQLCQKLALLDFESRKDAAQVLHASDTAAASPALQCRQAGQAETACRALACALLPSRWRLGAGVRGDFPYGPEGPQPGREVRAQPPRDPVLPVQRVRWPLAQAALACLFLNPSFAAATTTPPLPSAAGPC